MSTTEQAPVHADSDDALTTTVEERELHLVWPQSGVELDLAAIQGLWTEEMYLRLTNQTHAPIELTDGVLEILPVPAWTHQSWHSCTSILSVSFVV